MNGLPVDRQTFVGADETTYRGLQYCDRKYVSWQWVKERKFLITGVVLGFGITSWGAGAILDKLLKLL